MRAKQNGAFENLMITQRFKANSQLSGTQIFITVCTITRRWIPCCVCSMVTFYCGSFSARSTPCHLRRIFLCVHYYRSYVNYPDNVSFITQNISKPTFKGLSTEGHHYISLENEVIVSLKYLIA
jgi:hypothetical protein